MARFPTTSRCQNRYRTTATTAAEDMKLVSSLKYYLIFPQITNTHTRCCRLRPQCNNGSFFFNGGQCTVNTAAVRHSPIRALLRARRYFGRHKESGRVGTSTGGVRGHLTSPSPRQPPVRVPLEVPSEAPGELPRGGASGAVTKSSRGGETHVKD